VALRSCSDGPYPATMNAQEVNSQEAEKSWSWVLVEEVPGEGCWKVQLPPCLGTLRVGHVDDSQAARSASKVVSEAAESRAARKGLAAVAGWHISDSSAPQQRSAHSVLADSSV
jgi:hypothetical protein